MAAEQASEDSLECNEEPGALGACGDNDDAVRGARQSNEIAGGVHAADQEAGTRTEVRWFRSGTRAEAVRTVDNSWLVLVDERDTNYY